MSTEIDLDGQVAIVTGGAQGIGRSCATALAIAGAGIVIADLNETGGAEVASVIAEVHGVEATACRLDIADASQCRDLVGNVSGRRGTGSAPPEILVNCAALYLEGPALEMEPTTFRDVVDVCLTGTFILSQAFAQAAVTAGTSARIVNISSVSATHSMSGRAAYAAAKAGLDSLTRTLALEWGPLGIRVNGIAPSHVATETIVDLAERGELATDRIVERIPLGRLAEPAEVADAVVFLCSEQSRFVTGQVLAVDGGYTANGGWQEEGE
jgi:NAD(P)-dependent dehydrogenase (short-subunit alcohol dehydrogenase family)